MQILNPRLQKEYQTSATFSKEKLFEELSYTVWLYSYANDNNIKLFK